MRGAELPLLVSALRDPVSTFVRESRVRVSLIVSGSGQVLAQHGFTGGYEIINVAALAAATHASSRALAELTRSGGWDHLHHAGRDRQLFMAPLETPLEPLILIAIFDTESSLGLVQLFFDQLAHRVAALPELQRIKPMTDQRTFERDLEAGIERVFSSDQRRREV
jgi:predicted regulator of Ras-like GTPase activity (Roadblock/LC7/MglB family)